MQLNARCTQLPSTNKAQDIPTEEGWMHAADLPPAPGSPSPSSSHVSDSQQPQQQEPQHEQQQHQQHQSPPQSDRSPNGPAAQPAHLYSMEVAEMRHRLRQTPAQNAARHLPDAELLRHAQACGLLKVSYFCAPAAQACIAELTHQLLRA